MKFRKLSFKKAKKLKLPQEAKKQAAPPRMNEKKLRQTFKDCSDVIFSSLQFNEQEIVLVYCAGMINTDMLYKTVPKRLEEFFKSHQGSLDKDALHFLKLPSLTAVGNGEKAEEEIFSGKLLLIFKETDEVYSVNIADRPQRNPEEGTMEISVKGPRDNFIEDISVNQALIRKRLRTTSLVSEDFEVGTRTKTKIALLYIKDLANPGMIEEIRDKLQALDVDGVFSGAQLEELISDKPYSFFPRHSYTGRPDFTVESLLKGRFILLIDGVAYASIAPVNLFFLLKAAEDSETHYFYNAFERLIRSMGVSVAAFLPGFWVALTSFHQNQLPFTFLATVVESRRGVPFPTALEAILMLILFEVFREAGLRLPLTVGQTLSVIGGLIIGDAAIRAGLTSPAMLVVIAASTIATFTLVNQTLVGVISLLRFFVIALSALLGFFGFFCSVFIIGVSAARAHSFGVPYLQIAQRLSFRNALKAVLRIPFQKDNTRPSAIHPRDDDSQGGPS